MLTWCLFISTQQQNSYSVTVDVNLNQAFNGHECKACTKRIKHNEEQNLLEEEDKGLAAREKKSKVWNSRRVENLEMTNIQ